MWSTDITYIRLPRGFVYLVAIIDWYSRKVLSWRLSNNMDVSFCVDCLQEAMTHFGKPDIFNSDQGSQFTSDAFTGVLIANGITISMDGRGRALGYETPSTVYKNATGGGARIVDKFGERDKQSSANKLGQRQLAAAIAETILN